MSRILYALMLLMSVLTLSCATQTHHASASLEEIVESQFRELQTHYSRILGEPIQFKIVEVHRNEKHDYLHIVFDVSPEKYKPFGNKISTLRKDEAGRKYYLQMILLSAKESKYIGMFGPQIGVEREHYRQIEVRKE